MCNEQQRTNNEESHAERFARLVEANRLKVEEEARQAQRRTTTPQEKE